MASRGEEPPYLTDAWKLGASDNAARRVVDILEYRPNYLALRWTNSPNTEPTSPAPAHDSVDEWSHGEVKVQVAFKTELVSRQAFERAGITQALGNVGIDSVRLWFGYTQKMAWQVFNHGDSRPIRETNYEPEAILTLGARNQGDGFKLLNLGLSHESNGLEEAEHRGWNRAYAQGGWEWRRLSVLARAWHRIPESGDDNPDITDYMGHGDVVVRYQTDGGYLTSVLVRGNLRTRRGYGELNWATPPLDSLGTLRLYVQVTSGYGETLIDYNHDQTTVAAGVSVGRW
jgi:phospholipase A1